eukprot:Ihof_evm6s113 gene=Ihof_evmTU6s113
MFSLDIIPSTKQNSPSLYTALLSSGLTNGSGADLPSKILEIRAPSVSSEPIVYRIRYSTQYRARDLERAIRLQIKLKHEDQFCLINQDDEVVTLSGSLIPGQYRLKIVNHEALNGEQEPDIPDEAQSKTRRHDKTHHVGGHVFESRHFHTVQMCDHCGNPMFGIGKQGYQCRRCNIHLHKHCHAEYPIYCGQDPEMLPLCIHCKKRYHNNEGNVQACVYHRELLHGLCLHCKQSYRARGCTIGQHKPKEGIDYKNLRVKKRPSRPYSDPTGTTVLPAQQGKGECGCQQHHMIEIMDRCCGLSVEQLCELLFGNNPTLMQQVYVDMGCTDIHMSKWEIEEDQQKRNTHYVLPVTECIVNRTVQFTEDQTLLWREGHRAVTVHSLMTMNETPYGNSFELALTHCLMTDLHGTRLLVTVQPISTTWVLLRAILESRLADHLYAYDTALRTELRQIEKVQAKEKGMAWSPDPNDPLLAAVCAPRSPFMAISLLWLVGMVLILTGGIVISNWIMYL